MEPTRSDASRDRALDLERMAPGYWAASPASFYKDYLHLSGILLWVVGAWLSVNKQAWSGLAGGVNLIFSIAANVTNYV